MMLPNYRTWARRAGAAALFLGLTSTQAWGQAATLTGRVTSERGDPLAGATVQLVGTNLGAATNAQGIYVLQVAAERVRRQQVSMQVRFIGMQPAGMEITLTPGTQTVDFVLKPDPFRLDDVVVTGVLEATSNKKLAISVGVVTESQLQEVPAMEALSALTGKVSGVKVTSAAGTPGVSAVVRMRSATNLTPGATQQPLIIVDGVITHGNMSDINAQDIERIEVLKGASGSSVYGSQAATGVIQIFTRRGRTAAEGKTNVVLRTEYGQSGVVKYLDVNESHYCETYEPNCTPKADHYMDLPYPATNPARQHQRDLVGNGEFLTQYVSVSRRQSNTNVFASYELARNEGILDVVGVDLDGFRRNNVRLNVDQVLSNRLDVSVGGFYNFSNNQHQPNGGGPFFSVLQYPVDVDLFKENDNGQPFKVNVGTEGAIVSTDANPLYQVFTLDQRTLRSRVQGNARGRWRPLDWLSVDAIYAYDRQTNEFRSYTRKGTLSAQNIPGTGSTTRSNRATRNYNFNTTVRASHRVGDLNATATGSYFYEDSEMEFFTASGRDFAAVDVPQLGVTDPDLMTNSSSQQTIRARNFASGLLLDFKDRYIADLTWRRDGSSLFGPDARWRNFYRISGAWRVSEDVPMRGIDEFRVRASRGTAGLRPFFAAQYETFSVGGGSIQPLVLGNRDLRPAYSTENEFGTNIDFLNRFAFEYTYSTKVTEDQVLFVPFSSVAGFQGQWQNAGTLDGRTHEASLQAMVFNSRNWGLRMGITFENSTQKVSRLNRPNYTTGGNTQSSDLFMIREGETYGSMWGFRWVRSCAELKINPANAGADCNNYAVNSDGLLIAAGTEGSIQEAPIRFVDADGNDIVQIGDANPDFTMGFQTTLNYKGLTIYGLMDWVKGGDIYNQPRQWVARAEFRSKEFDQRGKPDHLKKTYDYYNKFNLANLFNEWFVEDGSYARLRELSVNYTFNQGALRKVGLDRVVSGLRVGLVGRNLFTITNYSGMDPETSNAQQGSGDATTFRFDAFGYPNFRTVSGIIEISF